MAVKKYKPTSAGRRFQTARRSARYRHNALE